MKILLSALGIALLGAGFVPSPLPQKGKWVSLFDGKTTTGWRNYLKKDISPLWQVINGELVLTAAGGGEIITEKEYENFELELEWKISEGGNSGIFYRVHEDPKYKTAYTTGPEMQILDDDRHPDAKAGKNNNRTAGSLYDMLAPAQKAKPAGEWNSVRLVVQKGRAEHWLNGVKVVEYALQGAEWEKMVKESKFATWTGFNAYTKGHIGLQDHGDKVAFRNIRIKEL